MLAKEVGNALARDRLFDGASELRAQPERDQPGYRAGTTMSAALMTWFELVAIP